MAARKLIHERVVSPASAGGSAASTAVPAGRAFVGKIVFCWTTSATGAMHFYAGTNASTSTILASPVSMNAGETFEQSVVLLPGEFITIVPTISNAGGVGTLHLIGEEVDN